MEKYGVDQREIVDAPGGTVKLAKEIYRISCVKCNRSLPDGVILLVCKACLEKEDKDY